MSFYTRFMICVINGNPNYQGSKQELLSTPDWFTAALYLEDRDPAPFGMYALLGLREDNNQWQLLYAEEDQTEDASREADFVTLIGSEEEIVHSDKFYGFKANLGALRDEVLDKLRWGEKEVKNPVFFVKRDHVVTDYWKWGIKTDQGEQRFTDPRKFIEAVVMTDIDKPIELYWNDTAENPEFHAYNQVYDDEHACDRLHERQPFLLTLNRQKDVDDWDRETDVIKDTLVLGVYSKLGLMREVVAKVMTELKDWKFDEEELVVSRIEVDSGFDLNQIRKENPL